MELLNKQIAWLQGWENQKNALIFVEIVEFLVACWNIALWTEVNCSYRTLLSQQRILRFSSSENPLSVKKEEKIDGGRAQLIKCSQGLKNYT